MATQEEVRELAIRLAEANEIQRLQQQQIAELQRQAQQAQQGYGSPRGAVSAPMAEFGANLTVDTRVLGRPDHFEGLPGTWRDWSTVFRA